MQFQTGFSKEKSVPHGHTFPLNGIILVVLPRLLVNYPPPKGSGLVTAQS